MAQHQIHKTVQRRTSKPGGSNDAPPIDATPGRSPRLVALTESTDALLRTMADQLKG